MRLNSIHDRRSYIAKKVREKIDRFMEKTVKRWEQSKKIDANGIERYSPPRDHIGHYRECKFLAGCCAVASRALAASFKKGGYPSTVIKGKFRGEDHCWVESGKQIYDITATQFGDEFPKIMISKIEQQGDEYPDYEGEKRNPMDVDFRSWKPSCRPSAKRTKQFGWRPRG